MRLREEAMKTEFELFFCNESDYLFLLWGEKSQNNKIYTTVNDFESTISIGNNKDKNNSTLISPIYTFP